MDTHTVPYQHMYSYHYPITQILTTDTHTVPYQHMLVLLPLSHHQILYHSYLVPVKKQRENRVWEVGGGPSSFPCLSSFNVVIGIQLDRWHWNFPFSELWLKLFHSPSPQKNVHNFSLEWPTTFIYTIFIYLSFPFIFMYVKFQFITSLLVTV